MKYLTIILALILFNACSQSREVINQKLPALITYVDNPNETDTLCISDIKRAKKDVANGKIVLTQSFGAGTFELRYEEELRQLCKENGLEFGLDLMGCVVFEGQTQGCYGAYMDKIIIEKFGADFKKNIHRQADSLFLENIILNNKVVKHWDCDESPKLPSETESKSAYLTIKIKDVDIEKDVSGYGDLPSFDLGFIIEKDSTINGFYLLDYFDQLDKNEKLNTKLFEIAVAHIKENYPVWVPGKIKGVSVRTDNSVKIFFKKE